MRSHFAKALVGATRRRQVQLRLAQDRSSKIMRRLLRDIAAAKESTGDTATLEDYSVLAALRRDEE